MQNGKSPDLPLSLDTDLPASLSESVDLHFPASGAKNAQNIVNMITRGMQDFHGQMNVLKAEMEDAKWQISAGSAAVAGYGRTDLHPYQSLLISIFLRQVPRMRQYDCAACRISMDR